MQGRTFISQLENFVEKEVVVAGWIHEVRNLGNLVFADLRDWTGIVQLVFRGKVELGREWVVMARGKVVRSKSKKHKFEIHVDSFEVLNKVTKPLPVLPDGNENLDVRLNYRYLDFRKAKVKRLFIARSKAVEAFREFARENGFIEMHFPSITASATEGGAEVFPVEYFERKAYLVQSPQLYKQLAVIGGLERVFSTMNVFRAEKHNTTYHLNEIYQMDIEAAFIDAEEAMNLLGKAIMKITSKLSEEYEEVSRIDKVPIYTYEEAIDTLRKRGENIEFGNDFTKQQEMKLYEILGEEAFIIYLWPRESRAFYSHPAKDERFVEAYDLFYRGLEIASGAKRIHEKDLLVEEMKRRNLNPDSFSFYIQAFEFGAPPHAGWAIGLDRFMMRAFGLSNIREGVAFPRDRFRLEP